MTAIIAWSTFDGKPGAASLYLASDSRITAERAGVGHDIIDDQFQKVFGAVDSPDIFAICGPIQGTLTFIPALMKEAKKLRDSCSYGEGAESQFPEDLFRSVLRNSNFGLLQGLAIFHAYRFGARRFGLTKVTFKNQPIPTFTVYSLREGGGLLFRDGSGDEMVRKTQSEYYDLEAESQGYSRWFWMSFHASLTNSQEVTCGGAPQLVGLYGKGGGIDLGVRFRAAAFVSGKRCARDDIEYRDELFQRVDASGILFPRAQPHARMGSPRIFKFAL